ncbi:efflux RND transporter periplasmic adaptor subunit [Olivibacter sp. CPCC 100613]|uniref:efflux RND transporter periplasmic adaptor subunit n=1 Tax=Olivibacter sp. CPCC 100613 TaxID=3079931 RepID=UPI002FF716D8
MKRNFLINLCSLSILLFTVGCSPTQRESDHVTQHGDTQIDSSIRKLTRPTNQAIVTRASIVKAETGMKVFPVHVTGRVSYDSKNNITVSSRVPGRLERIYIKYNFQPVRKGQLLFEIYSPELVAAQRELLLLQRSEEQKLRSSAIQKLQYLGMTFGQIQALMQSKQVTYRVPIYSPSNGYIVEKNVATPAIGANSSAPIPTGGDAMSNMSFSSDLSTSSSTNGQQQSNSLLMREGQYVTAGQAVFTIYKNSALLAEFAIPPFWATKVSKGKKLLFRSVDEPDQLYQGTIGLIQPTFNTAENFTLARIYLKSDKFPVGQLLKGTFAITENRGFWLPRTAVVSLGNKSIVFKQAEGAFYPVPVEVGVHTKDEIQILSNITSWRVAKDAAYLVDSEDFITANKTLDL